VSGVDAAAEATVPSLHKPLDVQGLLSSDRPLVEIYDLAVVDLDGVVYVGPDAVPGAAEAVARATAAGLRMCYLTNNASRTPETVADHLRRLGVPASVDDVLTSAQVGAALLAERLPSGSRVLVVGGEGLERALTSAGLVPVTSVDDGPVAVAQGFHPDLTWRRIAEGTRAVRSGLLWLATNLDLTVPTPYGAAPGNGSLVGLISTATGRQPDLVAGKPSAEPFLDAVRRHHAAAPLAVGDRLDTDLQGGRAAGMPGLALLSGVSGASDLIAALPDRRPTYLSADLSGLLDSHPEVRVGQDEPVQATCRTSHVAVDGGVLSVLAAGDDPVDLLRAACAAAWAWADAHPAPDGRPAAALQTQEVLAACGRFETAGAWAR